MVVVLAYVVCADASEAERIGEALVREKLAACANILPNVNSIFSWQGKIQKKSECLLLCKTVSEKMPAVEQKIRSIHSYDVPCICFYRAEFINADYEKWLRQSLSVN